MSINLTHLPYPGTVMEQPAKLLEMFEEIKAQTYKCQTVQAKRDAK